ncbi:hypothetical protein BOTBODRAFT_109970 [Botryobasidium botryosum FD-172 SS1]|uniref:Choline/carnitine acyltransferase domain-containing protein n=1 Tax=Botryobasidium botryosum (strain FD-172 SS1) TaxID=930990 RepID=A0A067MRK0_BOTB1|nr:hypothetical protein BOTBODRAFT_109970 [Botryobasidium botryosum FD-172 SS1]
MSRAARRSSTFANQGVLPRLPVPALRQSLDRYVKSLEPFVEEHPGTGTLEDRKRLVREFESGLGKRLQQRLLDLDAVSPNNWLNDTIWLQKAYHEWRAPLLINSNWWLLFHDDVNVPSAVREQPPAEGAITEWQVRRAAWLTKRLLDYRGLLERQEIYPDTSRTGPFCMHQYNRMYSLTRIPLPGCDALTHAPRLKAPGARHVLVMVKEWCYVVEVLGADGEAIAAAEVERRFGAVVEDVRAREARGERPVPVGRLTADERNLWAENREHLLSISPENQRLLTTLQNTLFAMSLDAYTLPHTPSDAYTIPEVDAHVKNCSSGGGKGCNRWFDKAISICVESNTRAGMMGEHSPCDALIPSIVGDWIIAEPMDNGAFEGKQGSGTGGWEVLEWVADERLERECEAAGERAAVLAADSDVGLLWFGEYGAEWIKKHGKMSPDAYIQMALQLAWYKSQGHFTATYETASTRLFLHGRTDVIRTLSSESRAFVKGMLDSSKSATERYTLLQAAVAAHNTYTRDASTGKGCDRHLMGLRLMMRPGESSALFEDKLFAKSQEWKLSTSGLSAGTRFKGTGFGTVWPDGYGINYLSGAHLLKFGIESKHSCETTSTKKFKANLVESLREMRTVCEQGGSDESAAPAAKL